MSMSEEVGFDDDSVRSLDFEKYKGTKGTTDRLAFVHLKDIQGKLQPILRKAYVHYIENVGYVLANDYTRSRFGEPTLRLVTIVGQYQTDKFGKIKQPFNETSLTLKFFVLSAKKYDALRKAHQEFPLDKHDLMVTCIEDQYQQLNFQSCKEAAWAIKPEIKKAVLAQVEKLAPYLEGQLGQNLTVEQIKEKLGENSDSGIAADDTSSNADDIIAGL